MNHTRGRVLVVVVVAIRTHGAAPKHARERTILRQLVIQQRQPRRFYSFLVRAVLADYLPARTAVHYDDDDDWSSPWIFWTPKRFEIKTRTWQRLVSQRLDGGDFGVGRTVNVSVWSLPPSVGSD
jgi:hypothetical protein